MVAHCDGEWTFIAPKINIMAYLLYEAFRGGSGGGGRGRAPVTHAVFFRSRSSGKLQQVELGWSKSDGTYSKMLTAKTTTLTTTTIHTGHNRQTV